MKGQEIRIKRRLLGMTQNELATYLKLTQPTVCQIENGKRPLHEKHLYKLDKLFGSLPKPKRKTILRKAKVNGSNR